MSILAVLSRQLTNVVSGLSGLFEDAMLLKTRTDEGEDTLRPAHWLEMAFLKMQEPYSLGGHFSVQIRQCSLFRPPKCRLGSSSDPIGELSSLQQLGSCSVLLSLSYLHDLDRGLSETSSTHDSGVWLHLDGERNRKHASNCFFFSISFSIIPTRVPISGRRRSCSDIASCQSHL